MLLLESRKMAATGRNLVLAKQQSQAFLSNFKIFILIGCVLLVNLSELLLPHDQQQANGHTDSPSPSTVVSQRGRRQFIGLASAGEKSKSKSSKTTVIAISGGGGGKAHPMPIPWPVVHCHHHHHHLKYVPKPVFIHHWVKKHKATDYHEKESNDNYQFMDMNEQPVVGGKSGHHHPMDRLSGPQQHQQALPSSSFAYNMIDENATRQHQQLPFDLIDDTHPILKDLPAVNDSAGGKRPTGSGNGRQMTSSSTLVHSKSNDHHHHHHHHNSEPQFTNKQLDKLTRTIITAQQKVAANGDHSSHKHNKPSIFDNDPIDTLKDNVVTLDNSTTVLVETPPSSSGDEKVARESTRKSKQSSRSANSPTGPSKPNHPFDEPMDQIKDESAPDGLSPPPLRSHDQDGAADARIGLDHLTRVNQREESNSIRTFERISSETAQRLHAMEQHNRQLAAMANPNPMLRQQFPFGGGQILANGKPVPPRPESVARPPTSQVVASAGGIAPVVMQRALSLVSQLAPQNGLLASHLQQQQNPAAVMQRALSESHAINLMTRLAGRMAQLEANNLVERQIKSITSNKAKNASTATNTTTKSSSPSRSKRLANLLGNLNVFSRLSNSRSSTTASDLLRSPLLKQDKQRRRSTESAGQILIGTSPGTSKQQQVPITTAPATINMLPTQSPMELAAGGANYRRFLNWQSTTSSTSTPAPPAASQQRQNLATNHIITATRLQLSDLVNNKNHQSRNKSNHNNTNNQAAISQFMNKTHHQQQQQKPATNSTNISAINYRPQPDKLMLEQDSVHINRIVDPNQPAVAGKVSQSAPPSASGWPQTGKKFGQGPRVGGGSPVKTPAERSTASSRQQQQQQSALPATTTAMPQPTPTSPSNTPPSLMSADQEDRFYSGQEAHLRSTTSEPGRMGGLAPPTVQASSGVVSHASPIYASQSSDVRQSIVVPGPQMMDQTEMMPSQPISPMQDSYFVQQQQQQQPLQATGYPPVGGGQPFDQIQALNQALRQRQQQQQQQQFIAAPAMNNEQLAAFGPTENLLHQGGGSFLQFPMTPQQWSREAMKALNGDQFQLQPQPSEQHVEHNNNNNQQAQDQSQQQDDQEANSNQNSNQENQPMEANQNQMENINNNEQAQNELLQLEIMSAAMNHGNNPNDAYRAALAAAASGQPSQSVSPDTLAAFQQQQQQQQQMMLMMGQHQARPHLNEQHYQQQATNPYGYYTSGQPFHQHQLAMNELFPSAAFDLNLQQQLNMALAGERHQAQASNFQADQVHQSAEPIPSESNFASSPYSQMQPMVQLDNSAAASTRMAAQQKSSARMKAQKGMAPYSGSLAGGAGGDGPDSIVSASLASPLNEMQQMRQFQSSLGKASQTGNFSGLTSIPNRQAPQMPQIPNIPQPPQAPNIPMPPPGMMQMAASMALPLAMARMTRNQNRFRNQQVNAAAAAGGSSPTTAGQRFLRGASNLTNRLMRPRRRPTTASPSQRRPLIAQLASAATTNNLFRQPFRLGGSPSSSSSVTSRPNRRRPPPAPMAVRFFQTVVDMSRRPATSGSAALASNLAAGAASTVLNVATKATAAASQSSAASGNNANALGLAAASTVLSVASAAAATPAPADKLKPKIDHDAGLGVFERIRGRRPSSAVVRVGRTATNRDDEQQQQQNRHQVVLPGLPPIALTDGSLRSFDSMTSPVDMLNRQLRRAREHQHRLQMAPASLRTHESQQNAASSFGATNYISENINSNNNNDDQPLNVLLHSASKLQQQVPFELLRLSSVARPTQSGVSSAGYQLISEPYFHQQLQHETPGQVSFRREATGRNGSLAGQIPVVANHFNLLMFTAQNVTGNVLKLPPDEAQALAQQQQQQQTTNEAATSSASQEQTFASDPTSAPSAAPSQQQQEQQEQQQQQLEQQQQQQQQLEQQEQHQQEESGESDTEHDHQQPSEEANGVQLDPERPPMENQLQTARNNHRPDNIMMIKMTPDDADVGTNQLLRLNDESKTTNTTTTLASSTSVGWAEPMVANSGTKGHHKRTKKVAQVTTTKAPALTPTTAVVATMMPITTTTTTAAPTKAPPTAGSTGGPAKRGGDHHIGSTSPWSPAPSSGKRAHGSNRTQPHHKMKRSTSSRPTTTTSKARDELLLSDGLDWSSLRGITESPQVATATTTTMITTGSSEPLPAATLAPAEELITLLQINPSEMRAAQLKRNSTGAAGEQTGTTTPHLAADYVRAIKLVRGVSYPWPPPTQGSQKPLER